MWLKKDTRQYLAPRLKIESSSPIGETRLSTNEQQEEFESTFASRVNMDVVARDPIAKKKTYGVVRENLIGELLSNLLVRGSEGVWKRYSMMSIFGAFNVCVVFLRAASMSRPSVHGRKGKKKGQLTQCVRVPGGLTDSSHTKGCAPEVGVYASENGSQKLRPSL